MITLKTLPKATARQVFDQCKKHLLKQMTKSRNTNYCLYRTFDKAGYVMKCAAGCFIAKAEYDPDIENKGWRLLTDRGIVPETHHALIIALQKIHDREKPSRWKGKLNALEKEYNYFK